MSKNTFTTTYRGQLTDIATIARWMKSKGYIPRSKNELLNQAVVNFANHIRENYPEQSVDDVADAMNYLLSSGIITDRNLTAAIIPELQMKAQVSGGTNPLDVPLTEKANIRHTKLKASEAAALVAQDLARQKRDQATLTDMKNLAHANMPISENSEDSPSTDSNNSRSGLDKTYPGSPSQANS